MPLLHSYPASLALALAATLACAGLLHFCTRFPPGPGRAAALSTVLLLNCSYPFLFDRAAAPISVASAASLGTWLSSFKALAWAAGRGPLAARPWSLAQFLVLYALPVIPCPACASQKAESRSSVSCQHGRPGQLARMVTNVCLTAVAVIGLRMEPPPFVKDLLYALWICSVFGFMLDGVISYLAARALGLHLADSWRAPWRALSVAEFWGQRWNQQAGNTLRTAIYEPIRDGAWVRPSELRRQQQVQGMCRKRNSSSLLRAALGLCLACFMSGVVHELLVAYTMGRTTGGAQLAFFSLQGLLILLERWALGAAERAGVQLHPAVRRAVTLCAILLPGHYLFFLPLERVGFIQALTASAQRSMGPLWAGAEH